jgi:hypothetical protein
VTFVIKEDILRLEITVDNVLFVEAFNGHGNLCVYEHRSVAVVLATWMLEELATVEAGERNLPAA